MFIIAQLPLADFRPLINGGKGRLTVPDWPSDNLDSGFIRGFGKISARNASSLGLGGEHAFADFNNALRIDRVQYQQPGWNRPLPIALWFRRLYYDGQMAGRFDLSGRNCSTRRECTACVEPKQRTRSAGCKDMFVLREASDLKDPLIVIEYDREIYGLARQPNTSDALDFSFSDLEIAKQLFALNLKATNLPATINARILGPP
jgi:hypothetical protein